MGGRGSRQSRSRRRRGWRSHPFPTAVPALFSPLTSVSSSSVCSISSTVLCVFLILETDCLLPRFDPVHDPSDRHFVIHPVGRVLSRQSVLDHLENIHKTGRVSCRVGLLQMREEGRRKGPRWGRRKEVSSSFPFPSSLPRRPSGLDETDTDLRRLEGALVKGCNAQSSSWKEGRRSPSQTREGRGRSELDNLDSPLNFSISSFSSFFSLVDVDSEEAREDRSMTSTSVKGSQGGESRGRGCVEGRGRRR